jgi:hypothetical protein
MIIREFIQDPIREVSRFDFFNDYKDTRSWLMGEGYSQDVVTLLDAAHVVWLRRHNRAILNAI